MAKTTRLVNEAFKRDIFPKNWKNPKPKARYDLVVIGGGPGGMTAATVAAGMKASVAIVEKEHFGGECLSYGCIPSKALLRSSRCAAEVRDAAYFGIKVPKSWKVNFRGVMQRVHRLQGVLAPHDSPEHFKKLGIDVFLGIASFADTHRVQVKGGPALNFNKAIIATGTQALIPDIPGLEAAGYLTNQTIFQLQALPARLAVLGAGPIGCELSQAFLRFGSEVSLITRGKHILPRDDETASKRLHQVFVNEGMQIFLQTQVKAVEKKGKKKILHLDNGKKLSVDEILIGVGRVPMVEGLNLEKGGIKYDRKTGIVADDILRSTNPDVYVVGDVGSPFKFTHISTELAKMAVHNALSGTQAKRSAMVVPWATFTDPEVAHIGLIEGMNAQTILIEMKDIDRAVLDGETVGFVKIHMRKDTGQILGATIMAKHAGEMISELATAMASEKGISALAKAIHPFPTQAEAIRAAALGLAKSLAKKDEIPSKKIA